MTKTFYIETFDCQMNAHDCERVIGTIALHVEDEADAGQVDKAR